MVFEKDQKLVSVIEDHGFYGNRLRARQHSVSSISHSSRIFYRESEGVPFKWEMQPGTPKSQGKEDNIPPLSPPPLMQSMGLTLPDINFDEPEEQGSVLTSPRMWNLKKMVKKGMKSDIMKKVEILSGRRSTKQKESSRFGDSDGEFVMSSVRDSSFSSYSSSVSYSSNHRLMDSSIVPCNVNYGPFCCSPWRFSAILDEGNTKIYFCTKHKTAFAVEDDGSFLSRILTNVSTTEQFSGPLHSGTVPVGVPFDWEMQPGTPKKPRENEYIPPPTPPPAVQNLGMPMPKLHLHEEKAKAKAKAKAKFKESIWPKAWSWIKKNDKKKENDNKKDSIFNAKLNLKSVSLPVLSKGGWRLSKIKRNLKGSFKPFDHWSSRKEILAFAKRKYKSFTS